MELSSVIHDGLHKLLRSVGTFFYIVPIHTDAKTVNELPDLVGEAIPIFIGLIVFEFLYGLYCKRKLYELRDVIMGFSSGIFQQFVGLWSAQISIIPYMMLFNFCEPIRNKLFGPWLYPMLPQDGPKWVMIRFIAVMLMVDLGYYLFHRFAHEWHAVWATHSVHHSGERYNLATALRQGATQNFFGWVFYLPLAMIGVSVVDYIRHNQLNLLFQFWVHTEAIGKLPWLFELIFNTASHHRMHHRPPGNCNYAGVLIIWDRIFCSFVPEYGIRLRELKLQYQSKSESRDASDPAPVIQTGDLPPMELRRSVIYGLAKPLDSFNPVYANFFHSLKLAEIVSSGAKKRGEKGILLWWQRYISFFLTKRVSEKWRIATSVSTLIPEGFSDCFLLNCWRFGPNRAFRRMWTLLWELPLPGDEYLEAMQFDKITKYETADSALAHQTEGITSPLSSAGLSTTAVDHSTATASRSPGGAVTPTGVQLSVRETQFLLARKQREGELTTPQALTAFALFLVSAAFGTVMIENHGAILRGGVRLPLPLPLPLLLPGFGVDAGTGAGMEAAGGTGAASLMLSETAALLLATAVMVALLHSIDRLCSVKWRI